MNFWGTRSNPPSKIQDRLRDLIAPELHETMGHYDAQHTQLEYARALRGLARELETEAEFENVARDDRISTAYGYGNVPLTCVNHPHMRWSTKNISYIGARTIYYELGNDHITEPECKCSINDLIVLPLAQYEVDLASGRLG